MAGTQEDAEKMTLNDMERAYMSWRGIFKEKDAHTVLRSVDLLYFDLFAVKNNVERRIIMPNTTNNTQNSTNALGEITALKSLLADSDYSILKTLEGLLACTSATGIIAFLKDVTADIKDIATKRAEWRARINELEEQFPDLAKGGS